MPLSPSWIKQNYPWLLVMLTSLVIRLCLQGSKFHAIIGLYPFSVRTLPRVCSSKLYINVISHVLQPLRNLVWVYLAFRSMKIIRTEAFTVYYWGIVTGVITGYRRQCLFLLSLFVNIGLTISFWVTIASLWPRRSHVCMIWFVRTFTNRLRLKEQVVRF